MPPVGTLIQETTPKQDGSMQFGPSSSKDDASAKPEPPSEQVEASAKTEPVSGEAVPMEFDEVHTGQTQLSQDITVQDAPAVKQANLSALGQLAPLVPSNPFCKSQ